MHKRSGFVLVLLFLFSMAVSAQEVPYFNYTSQPCNFTGYFAYVSCDMLGVAVASTVSVTVSAMAWTHI